MSSPHISVGIPTCNRPQDLKRCLESLADVDYPSWDIVVVDQGDDDHAAEIIRAMANRLPPLAYCRMGQKGVCRARNLIMQRAQGDLLAFLDDDCTVESTWLRSVTRAFDRYPGVSLVVGSVVAAPHDETKFFVPAYQIPEDRVLSGKLASLRTRIMSAGMYIRQDLAKHGPLWDIYLGPGAQFPGSEDSDYTYRVLASGCKILETPAVAVVHHGAREYRNGVASRLVRKAPYTQAVMDIKLLCCADPAAPALIAVHAFRYLAMIRPQEVFRRRAPTRLAWPIMYAYGLASGLYFCLKVPPNRRLRVWGRQADYNNALAAQSFDIVVT